MSSRYIQFVLTNKLGATEHKSRWLELNDLQSAQHDPHK